MSEPILNLSDPKAMDEAIKKADGKPFIGELYFIQGVYGEFPDCYGFAEEVLDTDEKLKKYGIIPGAEAHQGGTYIKLIGCSYLSKGNPIMAHVYGIEQAKSMISHVLREIVGRSVLLTGALGLLFVFARKRFIHYAHQYIDSIKYHTMRLYTPAPERMNRSTKEIRRAMDAAIRVEMGLAPDVDLYEMKPPAYSKLELASLISKATAFLTLIMQLDGAYRYPAQDMLGEIDKVNANQSGRKEMLRLLDLMIERNTNLTPVPGVSIRTEGVPAKFKFVRRLLSIFLLLSPRARRIVQNFLLNVEVDLVGLDDADWYFCLRRDTHNYRGWTLEQRLAEWKRIDEKLDHFYIKVEPQQAPSA